MALLALTLGLLYSLADDAASAQGAEGDEGWLRGFHRPGLDGGIRAMTIYRGDLVIAGDLRFINGVSMKRISRWDGEEWRPLAEGVAGIVNCMLVFEDRLYAGGSFSPSDGSPRTSIACWDGDAWTYLADTPPTPVSQLTIYRGELCAGTGFRGSGARSSVYSLSDSGWVSIGGEYGCCGRNLIVQLWAFGDSLAASYVEIPGEESLGAWNPWPVLWDGNAWDQYLLLGWQGCALSPVFGFEAVTAYQGRPVAGLKFEWFDHGFHGGWYASVWDGECWTWLGDELPGRFWALTAFGERLYASVMGHGIYEWDGAAWTHIEGSPNDSEVITATADGVAATHSTWSSEFGRRWGIALWNGTRWRQLIEPKGNGLIGRVTALAATETRVCAAGWFELEQDGAARCAFFNDSTWTEAPAPPAEGLIDGKCLATFGGEIFASGIAGPGHRENHLFRLRESGWETIGRFFGLVYGYVHSVVEHGDRLIAGGGFRIGEPPYGALNHVASYKEGAWSAMGGGLHDTVTTLCDADGMLFAGGVFEFAGRDTLPAMHAAYWNGRDWESLGGGTPFRVADASGFRGGLAVTGAVTPAGGKPIGKVWWWSQDRWVELGSFDGPVSVLTTFHGRLVAGGNFTEVGGTKARSLAWWDGAAWSEAAGAVGGSVATLAPRGEDLWVGGRFTTAGGIASLNVGVYREPGPWLEDFRARSDSGAIALRWEVSEASGCGRIHVRTSDSGFPATIDDGDALPGGGIFPVDSEEIGSYRHQLDDQGHRYYAAFLERPDGTLAAPLFAEAEARPEPTLPAELAIGAPEPNPFRMETRLHLGLPAPQRVRAIVFDISGRTIARLEDRVMPAGKQEIIWREDIGGSKRIPSGVYIMRLEVGDRSVTRRLVRVR